jgi:CBS domain-containing protein
MTDRLLVRDLMTVGVQTCPPDTPIVELTRLLLEQDLEGVVVLDREGHAVGVVTQDNLVQAYTRENYQTLTAEAIMTDGVPQIPPDIPLTTAAQIMQDKAVRVVFLMHHAGGIIYPAAVLSYKHILRHLIAQNDEDLSDLGVKAKRQSPVDAFIQKRDAARRRARKREE